MYCPNVNDIREEKYIKSPVLLPTDQSFDTMQAWCPEKEIDNKLLEIVGIVLKKHFSNMS